MSNHHNHSAAHHNHSPGDYDHPATNHNDSYGTNLACGDIIYQNVMPESQVIIDG